MSAPAGPVRRPRTRVAANLFGIPLGLCGLAQCWTTASNLDIARRWPADILWALAAVVWAVIAIAYVRSHHRSADLAEDLADPKFGPFVPVSTIALMLIGGALARYLPIAGHIVFWFALGITVVLGGWLTGQWMLSPPNFTQWHPGYFLPTVGGGLIGALVATSLGERTLGQLLFGFGTISWLMLGPIIRLRLFTQPALPVPLRSTLAIELAPPVIAGLAWFQLNQGQVDLVALGLAGYAVLVILVQIRLITLYRSIPFGPAWWAFSFPYAAAVGYAIRWINTGDAAPSSTWTWALLIIVNLAAGALIIRTIAALVGGRFLSVPEPAPSGPEQLATQQFAAGLTKPTEPNSTVERSENQPTLLPPATTNEPTGFTTIRRIP